MEDTPLVATPNAPARETDVLIIGGGPAGAAAGYWLARAGKRVTIVEKKTFPRDKTCGDGLTPRAVKQIVDMGLGESLTKYHRFECLAVRGGAQSLVPVVLRQ
jgi:flavin-dependent dehydrogenase